MSKQSRDITTHPPCMTISMAATAKALQSSKKRDLTPPFKISISKFPFDANKYFQNEVEVTLCHRISTDNQCLYSTSCISYEKKKKKTKFGENLLIKQLSHMHLSCEPYSTRDQTPWRFVIVISFQIRI